MKIVIKESQYKFLVEQTAPENIRKEWSICNDDIESKNAFGEGKSPNMSFSKELAIKNAMKAFSKKNKIKIYNTSTSKIEKEKIFQNEDKTYTTFVILNLEDYLVEQTTPPPSTTTSATTTTTTTPPPATGPKPMYGTPEQRAAAKAKREANRKVSFDRFVKGAFYKNYYEEISDEEYNTGCEITPNPELAYLDGTSMELPEFVYREQQDGSKIKINLRKYQKYIKNQSKKDDVGLDGLMDPNFKPTSCGISKAASKEAKKDWKNK